jgi:formate hydrogenlyase subunit 3/multisubunit Na+/H+ antiporter MnhD subunit
MGRYLVLLGLVIVVAGLFISMMEKLTGGKGLPGDIRIRLDGVNIFFPIVTCIVLSLVLTLLLNILFRR